MVTGSIYKGKKEQEKRQTNRIWTILSENRRLYIRKRRNEKWTRMFLDVESNNEIHYLTYK